MGGRRRQARPRRTGKTRLRQFEGLEAGCAFMIHRQDLKDNAELTYWHKMTAARTYPSCTSDPPFSVAMGSLVSTSSYAFSPTSSLSKKASEPGGREKQHMRSRAGSDPDQFGRPCALCLAVHP